ncbi:hypothetical protein DRN85_01540 [Methanosarcinales archaeon]|nr:MAG: hypothetical protein DRN85_01540 [Methanosarcinales archaeon]
MSWIALNSRSGVSESFVSLKTIDQKRILPKGSLPINVLDVKDLDRVLNETPELSSRGGKKETLLIEGYYPNKFGLWATHKVYRITYQISDRKERIIAKIMAKECGKKELRLLSDLCKTSNVPKPFHFLYDGQLEEENFFDVKGILFMSYVDNRFHFEEYLRRWCVAELKSLELKNISESIFEIWSAGIKHNDLKGEHLLFTGKEWFIIDFEKSEPFAGKEDVKDELAVLIGDSTVYLDRFMAYNKIDFEGTIKERYETFLDNFLPLFDFDSGDNRYISAFETSIQNEKLKSAYSTLKVM